MTPSRSARRAIAPWRFWLPLGFQAVLILLLPAQALYTQAVGTPVVLQTAPVDPYDFLRGYYVTLNYDISIPRNLAELPGWEAIAPAEDPDNPTAALAADTPIYVVLEPPAGDANRPEGSQPAPWMPVRVSGDRPTDLTASQIALRGTYQNGRILYGLERYYIPEDQRQEINDRIQAAQQSDNPEAYVVEVKIDSMGRSLPIRIWVEGEAYRF
ncbi:MAG: GDYXXLXY domain-containing protein [Synechococcales bacterium]|nr:GDYXXLXY domain-containing protein [Synechococcales bacterium]